MLIRWVKIKGVSFSVIVPTEILAYDCDPDLDQRVLWISPDLTEEQAWEALLAGVQWAAEALDAGRRAR